MSLLNTIRSLFGFKAEVEESSPIDNLEQLEVQLGDRRAELFKAQQEFNEIDTELSLKIQACDKLIEKGVKEGEFNKAIIQQRLDRLTDEFLTNIQTLSKEVSELEQEKLQVEGGILAKAIDLTSRLTKAEQQEINDIIVTWKETGLIKGEEIKSHTRAIVTALNEIVKGGSKEIKKSHEPIAIELAGKGDVTYDSPVEGHYANAIVRKYVKDENGHSVCKYLFLKRASDKVVEPGKYCLPGGHIDEGETIEQAACRELYEEANLHCYSGYVVGKAKADDGKWCFYVECNFVDDTSLALLDSENENAVWLSKDEWIEADLIFDLKDHLIAMESKTARIKDIPDIMKGESDEVEMDIDEFMEEHKRLLDVLENGTYEERKEEAKRQRKEMGKYLKKDEDGKDLEKGLMGEGSRGGKIIGHTRNGKPVYERRTGGTYKDFSKEDHEDAAKIHSKHSESSQSDTNKFYHRKRAEEHGSFKKAEDDLNPFEAEDGSFFLKAKALPDGTEREWGGVRYKKLAGKWRPIIKDKDKKEDESNEDKKPAKLSPKQLITHVENTSTDRLKKVIGDESQHPHLRDAAKRELERRSSDTDKLKEKPKVKFKKPPIVQYTPSDNLSSEHSKIEKKFGKYLNDNYDKAKSKYEKEFANVLNTDNARELSKDYRDNRAELSAAVHEPASAFIKKLYQEKLAEKTPKGKQDMVYFTAGGTGAGKSTGLMGKEKGYHDKAHIVYDTNMNTFSSAKKKIDQALEHGKKVRINYTFRDPIDAFENGAVPRSIRMGRTVPIEEHIKTHLGSIDSIQVLKEHYKGNNQVLIVVTDNSRGRGNAKKSSISLVKNKEKDYIASDLREKLHKINKKLYERGVITESHYKGFRG